MQPGEVDQIPARDQGDGVYTRDLTGGGVDYAFEVIGNYRTVEQAIQMIRQAGTAVIVMHLASLRSFGQPYLSPIAPTFPAEWGDTLVRAPWWRLTRRPQLGMGDRTQRMREGQMPEPDNGKEAGNP